MLKKRGEGRGGGGGGGEGEPMMMISSTQVNWLTRRNGVKGANGRLSSITLRLRQVSKL